MKWLRPLIHEETDKKKIEKTFERLSSETLLYYFWPQTSHRKTLERLRGSVITRLQLDCFEIISHNKPKSGCTASLHLTTGITRVHINFSTTLNTLFQFFNFVCELIRAKKHDVEGKSVVQLNSSSVHFQLSWLWRFSYGTEWEKNAQVFDQQSWTCKKWNYFLKTRCKTIQQTSNRQRTRRTVQHQLDSDQASTSTDETFKG